MIVIINYGLGNVRAFANVYKIFNIPFKIASDKKDLLNVTKIILPGVGAFDYAMERIKKSGMQEMLTDLVLQRKTPVLGICVGMQILAMSSEEGKQKGLGWIDAETIRFRFPDAQNPLPIPHMGGNTVHFTREIPLMKGIENGKRFYFTHSYHIRVQHADDACALTEYGYEFCSIINHQNITGVQFHPERSHKNGLALLSNFIRGE